MKRLNVVRSSPRSVHVVRPSGDVMYGAENMAVISGDRSILEAAQAHLNETDSSANVDEDLRTVLTTLREAAPYGPPRRAEPTITRLNIGNTFGCNMGCSYCYNELPIKDIKGSESPDRMSAETARATIDALLAQPGLSSVSLVFIGGEPLLDKRSLRECVSYARKRCTEAGIDLVMSVYTNATLMDRATVEWADEEGVSLVVSLDGPPLINDRHRRYLGGRKTTPQVLKNIRSWMDHSRNPWRRVNAVAATPTLVLPLARYLLDLGFNDIHIQSAYGTDGFGERGRVADLQRLSEWYRACLREGKIFALAPFMGVLERLAHQRGNITSWMPCTTGHSSLGVSPAGDLYPCHHFLEESDFKLGNVRDGLPSARVRAPLVRRVHDREPCDTCWARHACGGECYHRAHTAGRGYGGVIEEACDGRRELIKLVLGLFADLARGGGDVLQRLLTHQYSRVPYAPDAYEATDLADYVDVEAASPSPSQESGLSLSH